MRFAAVVTKEGKATLVEFPDAPGCQTFADAGEDVERAAQEALEGWLESYLATGEVVPTPPARETKKSVLWVQVRPTLALKILLRNARLERGWSQAELAKRVGKGVSQQMIAKIEDPDRDIQLDTAEKAAEALGFVVDPVLKRAG